MAINNGSERIFKMIIILEKDKITEEIRHKLLNKGLRLVGVSDKEIIFHKLKTQFLHWYPINKTLIFHTRWSKHNTGLLEQYISEVRELDFT